MEMTLETVLFLKKKKYNTTLRWFGDSVFFSPLDVSVQSYISQEGSIGRRELQALPTYAAMLRVVVSTLPTLRPLLRRGPLLNHKPLLRSRLQPWPFRALSSPAAAAAASAPSASVKGEDVALEEHLTRCAAAGRAPLRVAVLVSGGVDSSVALRLLHAAGHHCTAFYLKIWFQVCGSGKITCLPLSCSWNAMLQDAS